MSDNLTFSLSMEDEAALKPAGYGGEPLFEPVWFRVRERISETYVLRIRVLAQSDSIAVEDLIGRRVALTVERQLAGQGELGRAVFDRCRAPYARQFDLRAGLLLPSAGFVRDAAAARIGER